jgi:chemotaxis signal transduction protein
MIIMRVDGHCAGLIVDEVFAVVRIQQDSIEAPGDLCSGEYSAAIDGVARVGERLISLLNPVVLLAA